MKLVSCTVFSTDTQPITILTIHGSLVSYYLSKRFEMIEPNRNELKGIPAEVKNIVHAIDKHRNDSVFL